jgi:predicted transcriptional regulator
VGRGLSIGPAVNAGWGDLNAFVLRHDAPFSDVARVFTEQRVAAVPVVDDRDRLVGLTSYVDVFKNAGAL